MTDGEFKGRDFENWRVLAVGLYMAIVGYSVLAGIPVMSTAWSGLLGFDESQVGRIAGADLGGLSVGAVFTSLFLRILNRRSLLLLGIAGALITNLACMVYQDYIATLLLRFASGASGGVVTAVAVATLGGRQNAARAFNYLLFSFAFIQAGEMYLLPRLSMEIIYLLFALSYLPILLMLKWVPPVAATTGLAVDGHDADPAAKRAPRRILWLGLFAMALTYVNIGAYWTYIELAAADAGLNEDWVGGLLVWVSFFSVLGCLVATILSDRFGIARPLLATLFLHAITAGLLSLGITEPRFFVSLYAFNFLWIFIDVYQMGSLALLDRSGRYVSLMPAAQGLGQIVGPNAAASLLALGAGYREIFLMCAAASVLACLVYLVMYRQLRSLSPMRGRDAGALVI